MRIFILGFGNMGSWLAKELSKNNAVAVFDSNEQKTKNFKSGKVLKNLDDIKLFNPELFINAVSLQNTISAFESTLKHLPKDCIISDIASIKNKLIDFYKKCGFDFVSVHPMFGPTFANVELLQDENAVLIKESGKKGFEFFKTFFKSLGLNIYEYTFEEHDQMMAYSLTLPFTATLVFSACVNSKTVPGTTFRKHMKIAKGLLSEEDHLLSEILFNPNSLKEIELVTGRLEFLKHIIKGRDSEEAKKFFDKLRENLN